MTALLLRLLPLVLWLGAALAAVEGHLALALLLLLAALAVVLATPTRRGPSDPFRRDDQ